MLDPVLLRDNLAAVGTAVENRGMDLRQELEALAALDSDRRRLISQIERLKREQNAATEEAGRAKREGRDISAIQEVSRERAQRIKEASGELDAIEERRQRHLLVIPNVPHTSVPIGKSAADNVEVRRHGTPRAFAFAPQPHWDLGPALGIIDFERGTKIAGARFTALVGAGARLARALINFMLDLHTREHGYTEVEPPFMANSASLTGTGNLPKFEADLFKIAGEWDLYLVPTAEVPLTNMHRGEILDAGELPIRYTAYTPCFRSEAGSYGADVRGLIRQHQFDKVELMAFSAPDASYAELERLTGNAEEVLKRLELPFRTMLLSSGDMGFASAKTYDIEVWLPAQNTYREISSCSNTEAFQARRANIKFRRAGGKPDFVHTLNGSGLAVGRTLIAILENCQQEDGSIAIPDALRPYMDGQAVIAAK
jgi:seryl-tRNA synthetase